ncbi:MAG: DUF5979 domain-containing protein [Caldilineaceae bacterium]
MNRHWFRQLWPLLAMLLFVGIGTWEWQSPSYAGTVPTGQIRVYKVTLPAGSDTEFPFEFQRNSAIQSFSLVDGGQKRFANLPLNKSYQLRETLPTGWIQQSATCDNGSSVDQISISENEIVHCTFTNLQLGQIIIKKVTKPEDDVSTQFNFTAGGGLSPATFTLTNGNSWTFPDLTPGNSYSVAEAAKSGWALENATCSDGSPPTKIDVAPGETVTCTFTNAKRGQLVVRKVTVPDPDRSDSTFAFTTDNTLTPTNFGIKSGKTFQFDNLEPRNGYIIRELAAANWQLTGSNCSNGSSTTNIRIDPGETTTCTFTNIGTLVDLQLSKEDGGITAEPGDTIVYTLRYRNDGTKTAQNVKITEQVPAHTTFVGDASWNCAMNAPAGTICQNTITALAGGTSGSIQFKVKVNSTLPANVTAISNTAKLGYSEVAEVTQRTINTPLQSTIGLLLSKDDAGATAVPGGTVLYTLDYVNNGNQTVTGVTITETVPAHTTFVTSNVPWSCAPGAPAGTMCTHHLTNSLGVGQSGQLTFQVRVQDSCPLKYSLIENRAVIGSSGAPNADVGTEQTELRAAPDLTLAISDHGATVTPGAVIRYTLSYANVGTQGATGVVITENVPYTTFFAAEGNNAWNCSAASCTTYSVGNLASGASGTVDFVLKVNRPLPVGVTAIENGCNHRR